MAKRVVARGKSDGEAYWVLGGLYDIKVSSEDTGGEVVVTEMTIPVGAAPPPHAHPGVETAYVLEGRLRYKIGDDVFEGKPGSFFCIPQGVLENFEPLETVRVLLTFTPGANIDHFFKEVGERASKRELPPRTAKVPDIGEVTKVAAKYGLKIQASR